jgi:hypothetical protein
MDWRRGNSKSKLLSPTGGEDTGEGMGKMVFPILSLSPDWGERVRVRGGR